MPATYPVSVKSYTTKLTGDIIQAAHANDLQDEVTAVEQGLIGTGIAHIIKPDITRTRDMGTTLLRWLDYFGGRTVDIDQGIITADLQAWKSVATWNAALVTFIHKDTNITDTASTATSVLERWRIGGVVKAEIRKDGQLTIAGSLAPSGNNSVDIGLAANRWRDLWLGRTLNLQQGTITTDLQAWASTATWNAGAVTFIHKDTNITDTASTAASILERWRVGSATQFEIRKDGLLAVAGLGGGLNFTTGTAVRIGTTDAFDLILKRANVDELIFLLGGAAKFASPIASGGTVASVGQIRLPNNTDILWRNAANTTNIGLTANASDQLLVQGFVTVHPVSDNVTDLGSASNRWRDIYAGGTIRIGTNPATTGVIRLASVGDVRARNDANSADVALIGQTGNRVLISSAGNDIQWGVALVALGGGAAPTFGTIGGSGPATAAQNTWMRVVDSTGVLFWVPAWK